MRFAVPTLLLFSTIRAGALAQDDDLPQESDTAVAASWESSGLCAYFFEKPLKYSPLAETCIKYCANNSDGKYSECDTAPYRDKDFKNLGPDMIQQDDSGDNYVTCKCKCNNEAVEALATEIFDVVAEGLEKLDNVLCAAMLESFTMIADIGLMAIPGGAVLQGAKTAVKAAKSFYENGVEASGFFGNWVGDACGLPEWDFDLWGSLLGAPSKYGTSIGCMKKKKSSCRDPKDAPEKPKKDKPKEDKPKEDKPKEDKPKEDKPKEDKPKEDKPKEDKPKEDKPKEDKPKEDKPKEDKPGKCKAPSKRPNNGKCEKAASCKSKATKKPASVRSVYHTRRLASLEKRSTKSGKPCSKSKGNEDFELKSSPYPTNSRLDANRAAYGWAKQDNQCDLEWQSGTPALDGNEYDSEHVMEWQTVVEFFESMQENSEGKYEHPNPEKKGQKVDFCTYWIESWNDQKFLLDGGGDKMTAWDHISSVYPSTKKHEDEFIKLQKEINSQAKLYLFKEKTEVTWKKGDMNDMVTSNRQELYERMRLALGARKYLTEKTVTKIFAAQKERMGAVLDKLDDAIAENPRPGKTRKSDKYEPWKKQDLLRKWNDHLDYRWEEAAKKSKDTLAYIDKLDDEHCKEKNEEKDENGKKCEREDERSPECKKADEEFCKLLKKLDDELKKTPELKFPWS